MKILHICLASHYTEGMAYQDNLLPDQNAIDGHEVIVISNNYKYSNGRLVKTQLEDKILPSGVRLIRLKYDRIVNDAISSKVRKVSALKKILFKEMPDIILFHGTAGYELLTVAKYKKIYPSTRLYIDSHSDYNNSGTNKLSLIIQYKLFNNLILKIIDKYVDKYFYVSLEAKKFLIQEYKLPINKLEFYPLGGYVIDKTRKEEVKKTLRNHYGIEDHQYMILHSGKFDKNKKTIELLKAFVEVNEPNLHLFLIGEFSQEIREEAIKLIQKNFSNIHFLGWKSAEELLNYLIATDLYCQPGSQSATLQNAICAGTPVAVYPHESHKTYIHDNGVYTSNTEDLKKLFRNISKDKLNLKQMSDSSFEIANTLLDYRILAKRLYS